MPSKNPTNDAVTAQAYAGVLAASSAVVSSRAYRRGSLPDNLPPRLRIPALPDIPNLLAATRESDDPEHKLARTTAASLLYTFEKKKGGYAERILNDEERVALRSLDMLRNEEARRRAGGKDQSCDYCRLRARTLYGNDIPEVVVVNQGAQVISTFDTDTNIAEARIKNHQVLVRARDAKQMLEAFHPLRWSEMAPKLFKQSDEVTRRSGSPWKPPRDTIDQATREAQVEIWRARANKEAVHYIYEDVTSPLNERVSTEFKNILKISNFNHVDSTDTRELSFDFSLEACLESNLGLGQESGGLDIDGGTHRGGAYSWSAIQKGGLKDLMYLTPRDLAHMLDAVLPSLPMGSVDERSWFAKLAGDASDRPANPDDIRRALDTTVRQLRHRWDDDEPWLLTVSTGKRLRYAAPGSTPLALWAALTWMAPAQLFVFINRAVCQPADFAALRGGSGTPPPPRESMVVPAPGQAAFPPVCARGTA